MQRNLTATTIEELKKIRRHFHAHPELSGEETKTAQKVKEILSTFKPDQIIEKIGGTGVIAIFDSGEKGPTVLFRAELDALPIEEINDFEYRSTRANIAHKCGHDGHATVLLGLAARIAEEPFKKGKVVLLFQPSEENGQGAKAVVEDPKFEEIQPDFVFAFHNLPGFPLRQIIIKNGIFTADVNSIIIKLHGKTAHAAEPEHGINPAFAIAEMLLAFETLSNNEPSREDFALITPVHMSLGEIAYGIAAGYGELRLTIRSWTRSQMEILEKEILKIIKEISNKYTLKNEVNWTQSFQANKNDKEAVELIQLSAKENKFVIHQNEFPFKWGEDFGLITQRFKGAMFGIGAGENTPALHNPDYDFPDEIIPVGVNLFYTIAANILK